MAKLSKRARAFREKVEEGKFYPIEEAVTLLNELSTVKFKESIDVRYLLNIAWVLLVYRLEIARILL